jgi:uncharacterized membrane protein YfcA
MSPLLLALVTLLISLIAGFLGSLLGLGGGIIIVPVLTLFLGVDIHYAIGASIVSVIATSSGAAAAYVRERLVNLRLAMFLEIATTSGAVCGAVLAKVIAVRVLFLIFGLALGVSAVQMFRRRHERVEPVPPSRIADRLRLHGAYFDPALGKSVEYRVAHPLLGFALMLIAGAVSGLLGIGSGVLKVPSMDLAMRLPIKASSATSNFMIGVTAAASAGVYFARGDIDPYIAAPVAIGVLLGAFAGSRLLGSIESRVIRMLFVLALGWISVEMLIRGVRG